MTPTNSPYDSGADPTAELLRQALSAEAADVQPSPDALSSIQQRTGAVPSADSSGRARRFPAGANRTNLGGRPSWWLGALGAAAATAAVITAVVVIGDQGSDPSRTPAVGPGTTAGQTDITTEPTVDSPTPTTGGSASPSATTASATPAPTMHPGVYDPNAPAANQVTMYYFGEPDDLGPRLYPEPHTLRSSNEPGVVAAVREFLTSLPMDPDYASGWPAGLDVQSISVDKQGATTIHLTGDVDLGVNTHVPLNAWAEGGSPVEALLASAGITDVAHFTYNGEVVGSFGRLDEAIPDDKPLSADDDWRAWVSVTSPAEGQTLDSPVTVTGSANVFEANVNWELLDAEGNVIDSGHTMAGLMEWKDFTVELGDLEPGTYTIRAFESSPKDGRPTKVDDKTFTVP